MAGRARRQEKRGEGGKVLLPRYTHNAGLPPKTFWHLYHAIGLIRASCVIRAARSTARAPDQRRADHNFRSGQALWRRPNGIFAVQVSGTVTRCIAGGHQAEQHASLVRP